jgi:hypothetical protein
MWLHNSTFAGGHGNNRVVQQLHHRVLREAGPDPNNVSESQQLTFMILFGVALAILICSYISFIRCPNIYKDALKPLNADKKTDH